MTNPGGLLLDAPSRNEGTIRTSTSVRGVGNVSSVAFTTSGPIVLGPDTSWTYVDSFVVLCPGSVTGTVTSPLNGAGTFEDRCLPTAAPALTPAANAAGWNTSDVTVDWNWTDAVGGGGLDPAACTTSSTSTEEGAAITLSASCTNALGRTATASRTVKVDRTPPVLDIAGPAEGGTYREPDVPAVSCTATDATSGVEADGCVRTGATSLGTSRTVTFAATDVAGNTATRTRSYTVLPPDTTAPVITPRVSGTAGENGWYTGPVHVTWAVSDPETAVTSPACPDTTVTADTARQDVTCTATSAGGTTTGSTTVKLDATAPSVTVSGGPADGVTYGFGSVPAAPTCAASDATSGVDADGCVVTGYGAAVGPQTVTFVARDVAGNVTRQSVTYTVTAVAPGAPAAGTATAGDRSAVVSWLAPASTGGVPLTGYSVTATPPTGAQGVPVTATVDGPTTSTTLSGLVGGVTYTVRVTARNGVGDGAAVSTTVTPQAPAGITGTAPATVTAGTAISSAYTVTGSPAPAVSLASGSLPAGVTLSADGRLSGTPTVAGTSTFAVGAANGVGTAAVSAAQTITVTAAAAADVSVNGGNGQAVTATQPFGTPLSVAVRDAYGNAVAGQAVTFTVTSGSAAFGAVARASAVTDASGIATAPTLTAGRTAGTVTVTAALTGNATVPAATFTESVLSTTTARANLAVSITSPGSPARGGTFTATVKVTNAGPNAASAMLTGLDLGPGLTVVSTGGGVAGAGGGSVLWTAPGLASGASLTYTVTVRAASRAAPYTSALAAATVSVVPDPSLADNLAATTVRLT